MIPFKFNFLQLNNMNLIISIVFVYMCICTYWTILQLQILNFPRNVFGIATIQSLCFTCSLFMTVVLPLCYNFLWIINMSDNDKIMFIKFYGMMNIFGHWFYIIFPLSIPCLSILYYFGVFDKLLNVTDYEQTRTDYEQTRLINNGKFIAESYIKQKNKNLTTDTDTIALETI